MIRTEEEVRYQLGEVVKYLMENQENLGAILLAEWRREKRVLEWILKL